MNSIPSNTTSLKERTGTALLLAASDWVWELGEGGKLLSVSAGHSPVPAVISAYVGHKLDEQRWQFTQRLGQSVTAEALVKSRATFSVRASVHANGRLLRFELTGVCTSSVAGNTKVIGCARELPDEAWVVPLPLDPAPLRPGPELLQPRWIWDPAADVVTINGVLARMVRSPKDSARAWWQEMLGLDALNVFLLAAHRCQQQGEVISIEVQSQTFKGARWMRLTGTSKQVAGARLHFEGSLEDIEEQRQLRVRGDAAAERHRRLFAEMSIACLVYDLRTQGWLEVNAAAEQLYGYKQAEFLGMSLRDIVDPSDHHRLPPPGETPTIGQNETSDFWANRHRDGHMLFVRVKTSEVTWQGRAARMVFVLDSTEQRASAVEVRMLYECLERSRDLVVVTSALQDSQGNRPILYVNRAFELKTGYRREEVIGRDPRFLQGPASSSLAVSKIRSSLARFKGIEVEIVNYDKQGNPYWLELSITPVLDEQGRCTHMFSVQRDVTQRKVAATALAEHNSELERRVQERTHALTESVRALEAFSRSVSHDLLNPVDGVLGFTELLIKRHGESVPADAMSLLTLIQRSARRMRAIIDDLLLLANVRRMEARPSRFDFALLAQEFVSALRAIQPERAFDLQIEGDTSVSCDLQLFRVALDNLVNNAWKYTTMREAAVLKISARAAGDGTLLTFADNGCGFDPRMATELFGSFKRLHTEPAFPGNGIGLATVALAVDRLGGWIWAQAAPDRGAAFHMFVPHITTDLSITQSGISHEGVKVELTWGSQP